MTQDKRRDELIEELGMRKVRFQIGYVFLDDCLNCNEIESISDFIIERENKMLEEIEGIIQDPMIFYPDVRGKLLATINKYKGE